MKQKRTLYAGYQKSFLRTTEALKWQINKEFETNKKEIPKNI